VSLFAIIGGAVSMFSQAFHAAHGGTPVAAPPHLRPRPPDASVAAAFKPIDLARMAALSAAMASVDSQMVVAMGSYGAGFCRELLQLRKAFAVEHAALADDFDRTLIDMEHQHGR
jgi:hypothetical protein